MKTFTIALRATIVTLVLTGLIYPFVMTGLAQVLFPWRANGSLVTDEKGQVVGSELIAQGFSNPAYFQPRPSAAGEKGYDATSSGGSNLGPTSKKLQDRINDDLKRLKSENPEATGPIPAELVTASASGLDPHLSPEGMLWQLPRVAKARGVAARAGEGCRRCECRRKNLRHLGRTASQRADGQSGARSPIWPATPLPPAPEKKEAKEASPDNKGGTQSAAPAEKP